MKKTIFVLLALGILLDFNVYALENSFMDIRSKILEEANEIKAHLAASKDALLLSSMWDSCLMVIRELDAYFYMLGIFNTIKEEDTNEEAVVFLSKWLSEIKAGSELNIRILDETAYPTEAQSATSMARIKNVLGELNRTIDAELDKISLLRKSIQLKQP